VVVVVDFCVVEEAWVEVVVALLVVVAWLVVEPPPVDSGEVVPEEEAPLG